MSKTITSPVAYFPGTVTLSDPLTYPQVIAVEDALEEAQELVDAKKDGGKSLRISQIRAITLKGICPCVEAWNLDGFGSLTPDTFPASPRSHADELVAWLQGEVIKLLQGNNVPNEQ